MMNIDYPKIYWLCFCPQN